jgi:DNA topoisomerase-2
MLNEIPVTKFFGSDYIVFASYDGVRKIASFVDGLKPTARKVVFTMIDLNLVSPKKVDSIKAKVSDHTEYLHGQDSIEGVIVNIAQDFIGACNIPLLTRNGNFGYRLMPDASASRYIKTAQEDYLKKIFRKEDDLVIGQQELEGSLIEPKYFVPIIPLLLVNGSEGIAVGYAQKILPRNPKKVMEYIFTGMKDPELLMPWYNGFKGRIIKTDERSFSIYGVIKNKNTTTYEIEEVPVGYTYNSYMKVLNKMQERGEIQSFDDYCDLDKDEFKFTVKVRREVYKNLKELDEDKLLEYFKLVKRVTENYTCLNADNQIEVFKSVDEIVKRYAEIRIKAYETRKEIVQANMLQKIRELKSKILFINMVRQETIDLKSWPKQQIIDNLDTMDDMVKHKDSYDYLMNMPMWSINDEAITKSLTEVQKLAKEYKKYCSIKISTLWKQEYKELCEKLK